jgi:hypothetical protein
MQKPPAKFFFKVRPTNHLPFPPKVFPWCISPASPPPPLCVHTIHAPTATMDRRRIVVKKETATTSRKRKATHTAASASIDEPVKKSSKTTEFVPLYNTYDSTGADSQCESLTSQGSCTQKTASPDLDDDAPPPPHPISRSSSSSSSSTISSENVTKLDPGRPMLVDRRDPLSFAEEEEHGLIPLPTAETFSERGGSRREKGLRHFSLRVCQKLKDRGVASYAQIADDLVTDLSQESGTVSAFVFLVSKI